MTEHALPDPTSCAPPQPNPASHPLHCVECGYDLTGLALPHACPECGSLGDPRPHPAAVREWFHSRRGLLVRRPPTGFLSHLDDPACRRTARRRLTVFLILPCLVSSLLLLAGNGVQRVVNLDIWWEVPNQPGKKYSPENTNHEDRLFAFNFHLDGLSIFGPGPPTSAQKREFAHYTMLTNGWPHLDHFSAIVIGGMPLVGLFGVVFACAVVRAIRRFDLSNPLTRSTALPYPCLASLFVMPYVASLTIVLVACACWAISFRNGGRDPSPVGAYGYLAGLLVYIIVLAVAVVRVIQGLRPRRRGFPALVVLAAALAVIAAQLGVWYGFARLLAVVFG